MNNTNDYRGIRKGRPRGFFLFIFLLIVCAFLFLMNLVIYQAVGVVLNITNQAHLLYLGLTLFVLSGSFIVSIILGNYYYNWFTRTYTTISAIWMGYSAYLFIASFLQGIIILFTNHSYPVLGFVLFSIASIVSIYGVLHSRVVVVKRVTVPLSSLPTAWQNRKVLWVSDLHLGQILGEGFANSVMQKINALSPDIVFIGGDLFDGTTAPNINKLISPLSNISAPLGTYFITGNHEEFGSSEKFIKAVKDAGMVVLQDKMIEIDGVQIIGVDYHNAARSEAFKKILSSLSINRNMPSILLKHEPRDLDIAEASGVSFQISGHTHKAQIWPFEFMARLVYKGFAYDLKKFKNIQVFTSSGVGTWGPPMRVGTNSEIVLFTFKNNLN